MQSLQFLDPFNSHASPTTVDALMNEDISGGPICKIAYSRSGLFLAAVCLVKECWHLSIWDLSTCGMATFTSLPIAVERSVRLVALTWGQDVVLLAFSNCQILLYDCKTSCFIGKDGSVAKEPFFASGSHDREELLDVSASCNVAPSWILVFNSGLIRHMLIPEFQLICDYSVASAPVLSIAKSERHIFLIAAEPTNHVKVVDLQSGSEQTIGLDAPSLQILFSSAALDGKSLALIMRDKTIRIMDVVAQEGGVRQRHKLQDAVNKWSWTTCGFSNDSELVWGAVNAPASHLVYIWEVKSGALVKMLEGPRDELVAAMWDPRRPSLITVTGLGRILRWVPEYPVKWCAMVPGLEEIEENVEYVEREDEFDLTVQKAIEDQHSLRASLREAEEFARICIEPLPADFRPEPVKLFVSLN